MYFLRRNGGGGSRSIALLQVLPERIRRHLRLRRPTNTSSITTPDDDRLAPTPMAFGRAAGLPQRQCGAGFAAVLPASFFDEPPADEPAPWCEEAGPEEENGQRREARDDGAARSGEGRAREPAAEGELARPAAPDERVGRAAAAARCRRALARAGTRRRQPAGTAVVAAADADAATVVAVAAAIAGIAAGASSTK